MQSYHLSFLTVAVFAFSCTEGSYFPYESPYYTESIYPSQSQPNQIQSAYSLPDSVRNRNYGNIQNNLVPVALISSEATPTSYPALRISFKKNAQLIGKNDGYFVASVPSQGEVVGTLTGGPAKGVYVFGLLAQNNDGYPNNTRVSTTEDGVGYPIQIQAFFFKQEYKSLQNALNYRDGLIIVPFNAEILGTQPNPLFEPYLRLLQQVRNPNSSATISVYGAVEWLFSTFETDYFVHPSSYIDLPTGKEIPCATNISPNFSKHPWLSYPQWQASFEKLLNRNYQPEVNPLPLFSLYDRPFFQANSPVYYNYYS